MKTHQREILIYYNPESSADRRTVAHAHGLTRHIKTYKFGQTPSTNTSWSQIIGKLDLHPKDLMNKAHPYYQEHIRGREFNRQGYLKILSRNPDLLKAPIAIRGNRAVLCNCPTDIYRLINGVSPPAV